MNGASQNFAPSGGQFNTLAQNRTDVIGKQPIIVMGKGSPIDDIDLLKNRSKCKAITNPMVCELMRRAYELGHKEMEQAYRNTYYCLHQIYTIDGRLYGKYCRNRFCTQCNRILKAKRVNKYKPIIEQWEDPHFVVLTMKAQPKRNLNRWFEGVQKALDLIKDRCNKRYQRDKGIKVMGIRTYECNFNPIARTYNPHMNLIVPNREVAELLRDEWLKTWNKKRKWQASIKGQKIKRIYNLDKGLIEVVKYATKVFTEYDVQKSKKDKGERKLYIAAMHNIFMAMSQHRMFGKFGFKTPKDEEQPEIKVTSDYEIWQYDNETTSYINLDTDEPLFEYQLDAKTAHLLENCIDTQLE